MRLDQKKDAGVYDQLVQKALGKTKYGRRVRTPSRSTVKRSLAACRALPRKTSASSSGRTLLMPGCRPTSCASQGLIRAAFGNQQNCIAFAAYTVLPPYSLEVCSICISPVATRLQFEKAKAEGHTPVAADAVDSGAAARNANSNGSVYSPAAAGSTQPPEPSGDDHGGEAVSTASGGQAKRATLSISRRSTSDNESNRRAPTPSMNDVSDVCDSTLYQWTSRLWAARRTL